MIRSGGTLSSGLQGHSTDISSQEQLKQCAGGNSKSRERAEEDGIGATELLEKAWALLPSQALGGNGWVVKESVFKELGAGVKGEAVTTDQTSKKKKNQELSDQKVTKVENNDPEDSLSWSHDTGGEAASEEER